MVVASGIDQILECTVQAGKVPGVIALAADGSIQVLDLFDQVERAIYAGVR